MDDSYKPSDEQFRTWYENTLYKVYKPAISFRIGQPAADVDQLLQTCQAGCFTFITAWNPDSVPLPPAENDIRQKALIQFLQENKYGWLEGQGVSLDKSWPAEESLFVLGMTRTTGQELAKKFGQKAIVFGAMHKVPELVFC
ncbi:MAG: DUF3293 domain-containing protein [Saprospiraceae bacterium]|nr:DUF3293 domain-containing protein [Saprospiraceae bacterium]